MAKLYTGKDTHLSDRVVKYLGRRQSAGTEDIANRLCASRDGIRNILSRLKEHGLAEHDGRRPRTWKLREPEAA